MDHTGTMDYNGCWWKLHILSHFGLFLELPSSFEDYNTIARHLQTTGSIPYLRKKPIRDTVGTLQSSLMVVVGWCSKLWRKTCHLLALMILSFTKIWLNSPRPSYGSYGSAWFTPLLGSTAWQHGMAARPVRWALWAGCAHQRSTTNVHIPGVEPGDGSHELPWILMGPWCCRNRSSQLLGGPHNIQPLL